MEIHHFIYRLYEKIHIRCQLNLIVRISFHFLSKEQIGGQSCADPDYSDRFRALTTEDITIDHCFGTCGSGGDGLCSDHVKVPVTFNVDMSETTVSDSGVYLAGGGIFGGPGDNRMTLKEGTTSIYTYTFDLYQNTEAVFTFLNSNNPDWSGKENIVGLGCAYGNHTSPLF